MSLMNLMYFRIVEKTQEELSSFMIWMLRQVMTEGRKGREEGTEEERGNACLQNQQVSYIYNGLTHAQQI